MVVVPLKIKYDSIQELVQNFQSLDTFSPPCQYGGKKFLIIRSQQFEGSYGGLVFDSILHKYAQRKIKTPFLASSIGHGTSVLWWSTPEPEFTGDVFALSTQGFVGVTQNIFDLLTKKVEFAFSKPAYSRYYGNKAWTMKVTSS